MEEAVVLWLILWETVCARLTAFTRQYFGIRLIKNSCLLRAGVLQFGRRGDTGCIFYCAGGSWL